MYDILQCVLYIYYILIYTGNVMLYTLYTLYTILYYIYTLILTIQCTQYTDITIRISIYTLIPLLYSMHYRRLIHKYTIYSTLLYTHTHTILIRLPPPLNTTTSTNSCLVTTTSDRGQQATPELALVTTELQTRAGWHCTTQNKRALQTTPGNYYV